MESEQRRAEREKQRRHECARRERLVAEVREATRLYRRVLERYSRLVAERSRLTAAAMVYAEHRDDWRAPGLSRRLRALPLLVPWGLPLDRRTLDIVDEGQPRAVRVLPPRGAEPELDEDETIAALYALDRGVDGRSSRSTAARNGLLTAATIAVEALKRNDLTGEALRKRLTRIRDGEPVSAYGRWCAAVCEVLRSRPMFLDQARLADLENLRQLHRLRL